MALSPQELRRRKLNMLMAMSYASFASSKVSSAAALIGSEAQGFALDFLQNTYAVRSLSNGTTTGVATNYITFTRASNATRINAQGLIETVGDNVPRIDYDPITLTCRGLLVEEARTNLLINSNAPTMGAGLSSTAGAAVSPDGTMNAVRVTKTDATTPRYFSSSTIMTTVGGRKYAISRYFKYDGYDVDVSLEYNSTANWDLSWAAVFTITSTGVTVKSDSNTTSSVHNVGKGWYRAITTFTAGAAPSVTANPAILTRVTGDSGVSLLCFGGMLEENAGFATSYIPTAASTVTRNADVVSVNLSLLPYSNSEGALVAAGDFAGVGSVVPGFAALNDGTADIPGAVSWIGLYATSTNGLSIRRSNSVDATTISIAASLTANTPIKLGVAFAVNGTDALSVNGSPVTTQSGVGVSYANNHLRIGRFGSNPGYINGHVRQITYIPRRISDPDLQARTA